MCRIDYNARFGRYKANMFWRNNHIVSIAVKCKSSDMSEVYLQGALLRSILSHDFLFVLRCDALADICMDEYTCDEVNVKVA